MRCLLLVLLAVAVFGGCGAGEDPARTVATQEATGFDLAPPQGFRDRSDDPPEQFVIGSEPPLRVFLAPPERSLPVAILVIEEQVPTLFTLEAFVLRRARGLSDAQDGNDLRLARPASEPVDGTPTEILDVAATIPATGTRVFQRFVMFKRGANTVISVFLTAPSRRTFKRHTKTVQRLLDTWRWS